MKSVIFTEEQLSSITSIGAALFEDENDPRSNLYVRKLNRPEIKWLNVAGYFVVLSFLVVISVVIVRYFRLPFLAVSGIVAAVSAVYFLLTLKPAVICAVKIYQRYAPASLRNKCRFEPSCSGYMILAINKYGVLKGIKKGILRLKRCNVSNGGFDYP